MLKWLKILLVGFLVSCFYFPVKYSFIPIANTKNLMAAVGLILVLVVLIKKQEFSFPRDLFVILIFAAAMSLISMLAITYNQTPDTTYVTYIRSAIIWLSGAFAVCYIIWLAHKRVDVPLVVNYLAGVCVFQCIMAIWIDFSPAVRLFVDAHVQQGQDLLQDIGRLYGIGASLDVGGSRFAAVLCAISFMLVQKPEDRGNTPQFLLVLAFVIITVLGNMVARTTLVGVGIGLFYLVLLEIRNTTLRKYDDGYRSSLPAWLLTLAIAIPVGMFFYNSNAQFHDLMRFGFEGFFNLIEEGEWGTDSTGKLESMIVWPDNLETWIIGDGYFENQRNDANYIGNATTRGYYMGTDIGYLRFIFYCGIFGLIAISAVMIEAGVIAAKGFPKYAHLFMMGVLCNFVIWMKVSTDLFPFLSLFASLAFLTSDLEFLKRRDEEEEEAPNEVPKPT